MRGIAERESRRSPAQRDLHGHPIQDRKCVRQLGPARRTTLPGYDTVAFRPVREAVLHQRLAVAAEFARAAEVHLVVRDRQCRLVHERAARTHVDVILALAVAFAITLLELEYPQRVAILAHVDGLAEEQVIPR